MSQPPSLRELQRQFARSQHYQSHQLNDWIQSQSFSADDKLQLYRNNYIISLQDVLAATYPCTQALIGEAGFASVGRHHILHHPLQVGDVSDYGEGMAATIASLPNLVEQAPYLVDMATLEWKIDCCNRSSPHDARLHQRAMHRFAQWQWPDIQLHPNRSIQTLVSEFAVVDLWQAIREQTPVEQVNLAQGQSVALLHRQDGIHFLPLSNPARLLIEACQRGTSLGNIDAALCLDGLAECMKLGLFSDLTLQYKDHSHANPPS
ncbi:hypothetical protein VST7929_02677 [Vibrio stylophorae]|uniref:Putative DNA-binding domain-containing protein n=1 Tax=Vibrio stylophorae TaxID=659351 RepID=A0ABN8DXE4_9VIBR|nr:DNA-binding domain-containing protein [Vibrio stylophorae]CAH0534727.1 hypothetical protein VST7929_02677 [Vibrio stylophorae]